VAFKDHIKHYTLGAERFDGVAADRHLRGLIALMMACRYRRGFMTAVKAVRDYVRYMCRAAEQAERYQWKLNMLRTPEWRARVLKDLGGVKALTRWINQPPPHKAFRPERRPLSAKKIAQRERMKLCAKACAHPRIFRDPCRLDQEGITIWPDEFLAFEDLQDELAALDQKALTDKGTAQGRLAAMPQMTPEQFGSLKCNLDVSRTAPERAKVYAPP